MNITFIFGNGFDIQLGLASRYSDFLDAYIAMPSESETILEFKKYLKDSKNRQLWSDAENAMGEYLGYFDDENIDWYHERIEDFETHMIEYLEAQQNRCTYALKSDIEEAFINFITKSSKDVLNNRSMELYPAVINSNSNSIYRFITFNYTNLLDNIVKCCSKEGLNQREHFLCKNEFGPVIHIHGTLDSQIIMGVNDETQLDLSGGVTLTDPLRWELIKPKMDGEFLNNQDIRIMTEIQQSDIIYIYGVSYGKTDMLWWNELEKWLKANPAHKLVAFIREPTRKINNRLPWAELVYENTKRADILRKLGIQRYDPEFDKLINQIYIILNTSRLNMKGLILPFEFADLPTEMVTTS